MKKVKHISSEQLGKMVGNKLGTDLWINGMFNEIRRYPNEIPCDNGEIPSMIIPMISGDEKVEWGFVAGMSCLIQNEDGSIAVRRVGHFPACACLALLSLLYDAGAANGKKISVTIVIPDGSETEVFRKHLTAIQDNMKNVTVIIKKGAPEAARIQEKPRTALDLANSIAVVQKLEQTDVGRFAALVKCVNGQFSVGDDVTVTDGSFSVMQMHCPVTMITDLQGRKNVKCCEELDGDTFWICFAMWFPAGTAVNSMMLVKEKMLPDFTPEEMPLRPSLERNEVTKSKGFLKKLFG